MNSGVACVLFTDLVGSTDLMSRLGDARFDTVRAEHFDCLRQALAEAAGTEVKTTGDGLLAIFTSAVDALAGAVAAQQATDRHARRTEVPLSIRVGVALGEVVREDADVFGTPVVEAARLVAAARPGQILCTALVRAVAGSRAPAAVTDAGSLELKGLPEPVAVCEVAWAPSTEAVRPLPLPPLLGGAGRIFVGRDNELERARRLWKEVLGDAGLRLFLLAGEPGIGKTRLATELARFVHEEGTTVLAGRCDEDLGVPYQPFVEALRHYVSHAATPRLGRYGGELTRLLPELGERVPGLPEPLQSDPETERYRLFDGVAGWLADASAESPVLLVLDDLQWAAKPTILLLRHVLRSAEPLRVLVVVTYRDTDIGRGDPLTELLADLRREGVGERISLLGLDQAGVGAFLEAAAGHSLPGNHEEEFIRVVWEETEGNPFFVAEVIRHLTETGGLQEQDGRWVMTAPVEQLGIPEGVRDVVGRRLSHLPAGAGRILVVAAVAGLEFEPAVIASAGAFTEDELFSALEAAAAARLVGEVLGGSRYRFSHALVRATLYDEISGPRRAALHRKLAKSIEAIHGHHLDDHLPALAHHWARAAAPAAEADRAVDYATRAGDRALAQLAHDEAAAYYSQALQFLGAAGVAADDGQRLELLIRLGEAQRRAGDRAHRETLLAAARLAQTQGNGEALARAALANSRGFIFTAWNLVDAEKIAALDAALAAVGSADSPLRARLLATLALELVFDESAVERRRAMSDEALSMARRLADPGTVVPVLIARYLTTMPSAIGGRLADSADLVEAAESVDDAVLRSQAWGMRFRVLLEAGDIAGADRCLARAGELIEELGQPGLVWALTYFRAARAIVGARFEEAERLARRAEELGEATGQEGIGVSAAERFLLRFAEGTLDVGGAEALSTCPPENRLPLFDIWQILLDSELGREAEARIALARVDPHKVPRDLFWLAAMCSLATVARTLGEVGLAHQLHNMLLPYADQAVPLAVVPMPAVVHHLGVTAATIGSYDQADEWFRSAAAVHERLAAPAWLARTRIEWAAMLLRRRGPGDTAQARCLLGEALAPAVEFGWPGLERRARRLMAESGP